MELWEHLFEKRVQMCCGLIIMRLFEVGANSRLGAYSSKYGNRLPRIIAPPAPLAFFSFFYPLPAKSKWSGLIQQNWSVTIQADAENIDIEN